MKRRQGELGTWLRRFTSKRHSLVIGVQVQLSKPCDILRLPTVVTYLQRLHISAPFFSSAYLATLPGRTRSYTQFLHISLASKNLMVSSFLSEKSKRVAARG
ncbi:hypothetical protein XELAEV_18037528mg [Xenopus laevis]|uniref:Uncharacterized protein n=1 Tax=Xenopus laevis TaxID=8355 RepID=A0A974CC95_XENLA|nr:hypothetical protein XELAEV_18037528mg [Xenopus laevis]